MEDNCPVIFGVSESWLESILTASEELVIPFDKSTSAASCVLVDLFDPSIIPSAFMKFSRLNSTPNLNIREASFTLASVAGRLIEAKWDVTSFIVNSLTTGDADELDAEAVAVAAVVVEAFCTACVGVAFVVD